MNPLISVIVPLFNDEQTVFRCIESILNQTYRNLEIIIVDDGSTDNCEKICDILAESDRRLQVYYRKHHGVYAARNFGMRAAKGDYFSFVDADDYINRDYIKELYEFSVKNNSEITSCAYVCKLPDGSEELRLYHNKEDLYTYISTEKNILEDILNRKIILLPSCCGKLFKKKCKEDIVFPAISNGEYLLAALDYHHPSDIVAYINKPLYYYVQHDTDSDNRIKKSGNCLQSHEKILLGKVQAGK